MYPWLRVSNGSMMVHAIEMDPVYRVRDEKVVPFTYWLMGERTFYDMLGEWISDFSRAHPGYSAEPDFDTRKLFITRGGMKVEGKLPDDVAASCAILEASVSSFFDEVPEIQRNMRENVAL